MFKFKSLRSRLLFWFLILSLIPLLTLAILGITEFQDTLLDQEIENDKVIALEMGKTLSIMMDEGLGHAHFLTQNYYIMNPDSDVAEKSAVLKDFVSNHTVYATASLVDSQGIQIADSHDNGIGEDKSSTEWFQAVNSTKKSYLSDLRESIDLGVYIMNFAAPVFDEDDNFVGVISIRMDIQKTSEELMRGIQLAETGYVYVYDVSQNKIAIHPDFNIVGKTLEELDLEFLKEVFQEGEEGTHRYTFQGVDKIVTFHKIEPWGFFSGDNLKNWQVVATFPYDEIVAPARGMAKLIFIIVVITAIIVVFVSRAVAYSLARPLEKITAVAQKVAEGDLAQEVEEIKTQDEIGRLSAAFRSMLEYIRELVTNIINTSSTLAASSEELSSSIEEVSKATEEIAKTISQIAQGSTEQSVEIEKVNRGAEEIVQKVDAVNQSTAKNLELLQEMQKALSLNYESLSSTHKVMADTAQESEENRQVAQKGEELLSTLEDNIRSISQATKEVAQSIATLDERSQEVGKIVDLISGIAEQTNLLALNAAIEAARAGDAGRGFAVVAEEVRKLAGEAGEAAKNIATLVREIQNDTKEVVEKMKGAEERVEEGVAQGEETSKNFFQIRTSAESIIESVSRLSSTLEEAEESLHRAIESAQEVSALSEDNSQLIDQVNQSIRSITEEISSIASVSEENAASSQEVSASTEEQSASLEEISSATESLAKLAQELQKLVEKFRV